MTGESWNNGKKEVAVAIQQHGKYVPMATNERATVEEPFEAMYFMRPELR
jgi:hypothetical protein